MDPNVVALTKLALAGLAICYMPIVIEVIIDNYEIIFGFPKMIFNKIKKRKH